MLSVQHSVSALSSRPSDQMGVLWLVSSQRLAAHRAAVLVVQPPVRQACSLQSNYLTSKAAKHEVKHYLKAGGNKYKYILFLIAGMFVYDMPHACLFSNRVQVVTVLVLAAVP